jgi:hypothetical protein
MLTSTTFQADGPEKLGMSGPPLDKPVGGEFPYLHGVKALAYTVPQSKRFRAASMTFSIRPNTIGLANVAGLNAGVWKAFIGASQLTECRFLDQPVPFPQGADEIVVPFYSAFQLPSIGEGVVCPSGTALEVKVTPEQNTIVVWYVTVFGKTASGVDIKTARIVTSTTTENQVLLTYTPSTDYTILSITVSADMSAQYFGQARICLNGNQVAELPPMGMEPSTPTFAREDGYAGCGMGALTIPLWGITFGEGDTFDFEPVSFTDDDARWTLMIAGAEQDITAPSGGGITRRIYIRRR